MPRNIRYLPNDHKNFCIFRIKSVFLMAAQNRISVRTQNMSTLYEQQWNCDPKEKKFWDTYCFFCFCIFSLLVPRKPTLGGFDMLLLYFCKCLHICNTSKHLKFSSYLYKHKSLCSFPAPSRTRETGAT